MDSPPAPAEDDGMSTRTARLRRPRRTEHRWTIAAATILAAVLLVGCGPPDPPDPRSGSAVEARTATVAQVQPALDEVVDILGGQVLGESSVDQCYEGQRNYKVDTGYHYRCSLLLGVLISVDGDFRRLMISADAALEDLQWQSRGDWPGQLVDEYWELRASENADGRVRLHRLPGPRSLRRNDLRLGFSYGSTADDRGLEGIDRSQRSTLWCCGAPYYEDLGLIDVDRAVEAADHEHLTLITIEAHYLQR